MKQMSTSELQNRIDTFMASKLEVFPELRHQPEVAIEEPTERRSIGQWLRDSVTLSRSARLS